jgi:hypothetical protein
VTLRYIGAGEGLAELNRFIGVTQEQGAIPGGVDLGGDYGKDDVIGTLRHLAQHWSEQPPVRSSERRQVAGRITVVPGLRDILRALEPSDDDTLDFSLSQAAGSGESWIVEDVSDGGYGALIPTVRSDWIKVGTLVGVQNEASQHWGIGLIRRIVRDAQQQRHVGIQLLATNAIPARISMSQTLTFTGADSDAQRAILLSAVPDGSGEVAVVMRSSLFSGRENLEMTVRDKSFQLTPVGLVESSEDFAWVKFKAREQRGA